MLFLLTVPLSAQLSPQQRVADFQQLAAVFSKYYAFTEWKQSVFGFDGLDTAPWLARIAAAKDDTEYLEICAQYVAKFQDGHTHFLVPTDFQAQLGFTVDIYDGRVLIDSVDRKILPIATFPPLVGDELVSIDQVVVADIVKQLSPMFGDGNPRTIQRTVAGFLPNRFQELFPRVPQLGDNATLQVRRQSGALETYQIPWVKSGLAYTTGPAPTPGGTASSPAENAPSPFPVYMQRTRAFQQLRRRKGFSLGEGLLNPVFQLPTAFVQRHGSGRFDTIFTGVFPSGGLNIGYLRLADFEGYIRTELEGEIAWFNANTDGLIVDMMRNPGGFGCDAEDLAAHLMTDYFHSLGISVRVTWGDVFNAYQDLQFAKDFGATDAEIAELQQELKEFEDTYAQSRGFTIPLPICGASKDIAPATNKAGANIGYSKPVMILTDELTASAAELFSAIMQDNNRALIFGYRTDGAGGAVENLPTGLYTETSVNVARAILIRKSNVVTAEYPAMNYIENIGVRPDQTYDYMTVANLSQNGKPFVDAFLAAAVSYIQSQKGK